MSCAAYVFTTADRAKDAKNKPVYIINHGTDQIKTRGNGVILFQGMQDHTAETIKSLEAFDRAWVEEAQTLSERSLTLLRPTIRAEGSEIWASWNPRRKTDAIATAAVTGPTSRQLQRGSSRIVNGALPARSISSSVGAAMRGSYTAAISGM